MNQSKNVVKKGSGFMMKDIDEEIEQIKKYQDEVEEALRKNTEEEERKKNKQHKSGIKFHFIRKEKKYGNERNR